jgi:hypothetical protein
MTAQIFVSYRRQDAASEAGRIADWLDRRFGDREVFMDINALRPGADFVNVIEDAVGSVEALVAVIGDKWLGIQDVSGRRRLDDPEDFVRLEIGTALRRGVPVIPVLVRGATMPVAKDLPVELAALSRIQALELGERQWRAGIEELIATLEGASRTTARRERARLWQPTLALIAGLVLLVIQLARLDIFSKKFGSSPSRYSHHELWTVSGFVIWLPMVGLMAAAATAGFLFLRRSCGRRWFGVGLLAAAGVMLSLFFVGRALKNDSWEWLAITGGLLLVASAAWAFWLLGQATGFVVAPWSPALAVRSAIVGGSVLMAIGLLIPVNDTPTPGGSDIVGGTSLGWPFVAALVVATALGLSPTLRLHAQFVAGLLMGCALGSLLLWPRYVYIPAAQESWGWGGLVGAIGAFLLCVGAIAQTKRNQERAVTSSRAVLT